MVCLLDFEINEMYIFNMGMSDTIVRGNDVYIMRVKILFRQEENDHARNL